VLGSHDFGTFVRLAKLHGLEPVSDVASLPERLSTAFERYLEVELRSDGSRIDLVTLTESVDALDAFLSVLSDRGLDDEALSPLRAVARFGAGHVMGMKLPIAGDPLRGEVYVRGAIALEEACAFLERRGVSQSELDRLGDVAGAFSKSYTHMLAADASVPAQYTAFFTTYLDGKPSDDDRLTGALEAAGIEASGVADALALTRLLKPKASGTLFLSICLGEPGLAKIDIEGIRLGLFAEAVAEVESDLAAGYPARWGEILGTTRANYAGVIVGNRGPTGLRAYFTRHTAPFG